MTRISEGERIVKLMLFIRENGPINLAGIRQGLPQEYGRDAGSAESVRRRFERDKKTLQECGIFLVVDDQQRYSLDSQRSIAAPLKLTSAQVSLLRLLCGALLEDESYPLKDELRMVLVKLGDELDVPDMLPQAEHKAENGKRSGFEPAGLAKVKKAITTRKRLDFAYRNSKGVQSTRTVEPFGCFFLKDACYVVAYDLTADAERCFRLDRMEKPHVNASNPKTPDFDERPFDAADYYGLPFQFGEQHMTARILFDQNAEARVRELTMGQGSVEHVDEGILWSVTCRDTEALARWCIENAPGLRILEPSEAARAQKAGIEAYLRKADELVQGGAR